MIERLMLKDEHRMKIVKKIEAFSLQIVCNIHIVDTDKISSCTGYKQNHNNNIYQTDSTQPQL